MIAEKSETVKVVVRCRPMSQKEINEQNECAVNVDMKAHTITVCNPTNRKEVKNFTFDNTYDWKSSQESIFNETAKPILESVMQGYNGTIFAYGQTGTGKTYTMEGNDNDTDKGITPRSIYWIFDNIKNYTNQQFLVRSSFVEIYNEEVRDLLGKNHKAKLNVREKNKVFYLEGVNVFQCENPEKMLDVMKSGRINRATGATKMNIGSSRSHSIFTIIVENSSVDDAGETHYRVGKLNLVDLAGSERQSKTESTGERFKEGTKINLSLTILGSVINKLVSAQNSFIPYRDSKLTMLLQDSLGGNTKTVMIANVGPADYNYDETLNALWYASHAKLIKNKPRINEDPKDALLRQFQEEIELLKKKLMSMGKGALISKISGGKGAISSNEEESQISQVLENLEKEKEDFRRQREEEIKNVKRQKNMAEEEKKQLIEKLNSEVEAYKKQKDESKSLFAKYKQMKSSVLKGKETEMKVKQLEVEISKQHEENEIKRREEERLKEKLDNQNKENIELNNKYQSKQAHVDDLNNKIAMIMQRIQETNQQKKESEQQFAMEEIDFNDLIRDYSIENKKLEFIISKLVPKEEKEKIEKCIEYNEKENDYAINNKNAIRDNYKTNMGIIKQMKMNRTNNNKMRYLQEERINLKLEMHDPLCVNFSETHAPEVVKEIEKILFDDDTDLLYFDPECKLLTSDLTPKILNIPITKMDSNSNNTTMANTTTQLGVKPVIKKMREK